MENELSTLDVSVIIPNYNHARYFSKRINSVLNQTFNNYEIIILDDCSKDNSKLVIEQFRRTKNVTHIIYNDENSGSTFLQWQKGITLAKGEYIWIAESDDYSDNQFLEKLLPIISKQKNIGLVFCDSRIIDENDKYLYEWNFMNIDVNRNSSSYLFEGRDFCFKHLIQKNIIPNASAVIFRKKIVLSNINWIDGSLKNCGDWKLWLNISLVSDIAYLPETLNYFRKHTSNVTGSLLLQKKESIIILKSLLEKTLYNSEVNLVYKSLLTWSFNPAEWVRKIQINHSNIRFYFKNNISLRSFKFFILYLIKMFRVKNVCVL